MEQVKPKMTDEERLALAAKLDTELDAFIDGLEKKRYTEGWPEDRWEEEMDKHPFFMKNPPKPGDDIHPLLEGIQQLKYDPEENSAEDLAENYKEDGNFYMKHKKFRMAIMGFSEGLKVKCKNNQINSILYNNRSAAHFFLRNYRSSLNDALKALELNPDYQKAKRRAAQCSFHINDFQLCIKLCDELLDTDAENKEAMQLMKECRKKQMEKERDERRRQIEQKKKKDTLQRVFNVLRERKVKFDDRNISKGCDENLLQPSILPLEDHPVHLDDNGFLVWPVVFLYPEFETSDYQQELNEQMILEDVINDMFSEPMECDPAGLYGLDAIIIYYENRVTGTIHRVNSEKTIKQIVAEENFYVTGGCLQFYVMITDSHAHLDFVKQQRRPLKIS